jgi:hypothetical protein
MKTTLLSRYWILLAVLLSLGGGCTSMDSMGSKMKDRIAPVPPRVRVVNGDLHQVYEAARQAMEHFDYHFTEGGPAQGRLQGLSRIEGNGGFGSSLQRSISIHMEALDGGRVEIQVKMTEIIEEDSSRSAMSATETPVRDAVAYDAFFDEVVRRLAR